LTFSLQLERPFEGNIVTRNMLALVLVVLLAGCQPPEEDDGARRGSPSGGKLRIAVIPKGTTHAFWKSVHYGAVQAAKEFDAEISWLGPLLEEDREGQINVVQNFITGSAWRPLIHRR
jgi:ribose transport system substrate-binding protein